MKVQTVFLLLFIIVFTFALKPVDEENVEDYFNENDVDAQFDNTQSITQGDDSENEFEQLTSDDLDAQTMNAETQSTDDVSEPLESTVVQKFDDDAQTLKRRSGGFRSRSTRRSSGFRSSRSRSRSSFRSSRRRSSSSGFRSRSRRSSRRRSRSISSSRRRSTKIKVRIPYTTFRTRYKTSLFRRPRPFVVNYGGHTFNTFNTYTYNGTFSEPVILTMVGNNIYRRTTMRIRYRANGVFTSYWRNVIIDLVTGSYYIIDPSTTAGNTPIATSQTLVNGVPVQHSSGAGTLSTSNTVVITQAPAGSQPSANDEESQNAFRMQDASSQDTLAVEYKSNASGLFLSVFAIAISLLAMLL